ncbi:MAG TPA: FkbM family methyltransferase [Dongiaceae bacterium]|nr:FkbM family methyltransferase [Dongiaceae bacterium]
MDLPAILARTLGADPLHCIDVGARGGPQAHWRRFAAVMQTDLFEPDAAACEAQAAQKRPGESWFPVALGGHTGTGRLYVLKKPSGSSLYPPNEPMLNRFGPTSYGTLDKVLDVPLMTLSDFIDKYRRPLPNLVKLDVQGAELDILKAVRPEHWRDLLAVQAEVEFVEFYRGQPLFHDIDAFMRAHGFVMFDFLPVRSYRFDRDQSHGLMRRHLNIVKNRRDISCRLIAGDAFYIRPTEEIAASGDLARALKLFTVLLVYRFLDEALWLVEALQAKGTVSAADAAALIGLVRSAAPAPDWVQRNDALGRLARRFTKKFGIGRARKIDYWLDRSWDF